MSQFHVRWMIQRDLPEVLAIENLSFPFPWSEEDFLRCLRQRNCIGKVAEAGERVVGFLIYELLPKRLQVLNIAVHPDWRRRGVGKALITDRQDRLTITRRTRITLEVRETNLEAQLFFRAVGFRAMAILRDFYEDTTEDAYRMQWRLQAEGARDEGRGARGAR